MWNICYPRESYYINTYVLKPVYIFVCLHTNLFHFIALFAQIMEIFKYKQKQKKPPQLSTKIYFMIRKEQKEENLILPAYP